MLIGCPNCKVSFAVPAKAIGNSGRNLKCSKCSHIWFQEPLNFDRDKLDQMLTVEAPKDEENKQLPAKIKDQKIYYKLLILLILTVAAFYLEKMKSPDFSGVKDYQQLSFSGIAVKNNMVDGKYNFLVTGKIINSENKIAYTKPVTIKIYDKAQKVIKESTIKLDTETIAPKASYNFSITLDNVNMAADKVVIESEHWLEKLFIR